MKTFFSKLFLMLGMLVSISSSYATVGVTDAQNLAIAIQSDGSIITAGYVELNNLMQFSTVQYTSAGIPNTSYGNNGYFATPFGMGAVANGVALLSNNEAIAVGYGEVTGGTSFALELVTTSGTLDTSFNGTGTNTTLIGQGADASGVAIDSSGNYIAAGVAVFSGTPSFALARYTSAGVLDTTFGSGGIVTTLIGFESIAYAIALQSNGQIVVAGFAQNSQPNFAVARYNTDGSLDTTFNSSGSMPGTVTTPIGADQANAYALAIQPNGQLVVGGISNNSMALVRYNTDGSLDSAFGTGGIVQTTIPGQSASQIQGIVIQSDGNIVVAGTAGSYAIIARYSGTDGSLDTTFNSTGSQPGVVTALFGEYSAATCVALNGSGQIIIGGYSDQGALVARFNTDGSLDTTFGTSGFTTFPNSSVGPDIFGLTSANLASDAGILYTQLNLEGSIVNSDISPSAAIVDTKLATIQTAGTVLNSATTATSANTASAIVARDTLGNFVANTITANLIGVVTGSASNNVLKAGDTMTGSLVLPAGSAANPSLQFSGSTNSGLSLTSGTLTLSTSGVSALSIDSNGGVTIATPNASETGLTISGGGAAITGDVTISGNASFNTSSTALNNIGSTQGPAVKMYYGTGNSGVSGSTTISYTAAGFVNPPQIYLTSTTGVVAALGVNSVSNTSATVLSGSTLNVPFSYLAVGV